MFLKLFVKSTYIIPSITHVKLCTILNFTTLTLLPSSECTCMIRKLFHCHTEISYLPLPPYLEVGNSTLGGRTVYHFRLPPFFRLVSGIRIRTSLLDTFLKDTGPIRLFSGESEVLPYRVKDGKDIVTELVDNSPLLYSFSMSL